VRVGPGKERSGAAALATGDGGGHAIQMSGEEEDRIWGDSGGHRLGDFRPLRHMSCCARGADGKRRKHFEGEDEPGTHYVGARVSRQRAACGLCLARGESRERAAAEMATSGMARCVLPDSSLRLGRRLLEEIGTIVRAERQGCSASGVQRRTHAVPFYESCGMGRRSGDSSSTSDPRTTFPLFSG